MTTMEREKVMSWVLLVWMACGGAATISVDQTSDYCSRVQLGLNCVFTNTSEEVELGEVGRGLLSVKVEGATALRGSPPCGARLLVSSSRNVTLQGALTRAEDGAASVGGVRRRRSSKERQADGAHTPDGRPSPGVTVFSTTSQQTVTSSVSRTSVSVSVSTEERRAACVLNVTVVQSQVHWLRGQWDEVSVESSEVVELAGEMGRLAVRSNSTVSNFSVSGNRVSVEETRVWLLSRLEARQQLLLRDVDVGSLVSPGLMLHASRDGGVGGGVGGGSAGVHTLTDVTVNVIHTEAVQVMSGRVSITNMVVEEAHSAAFMVKDGGVLTLKNVNIRRGPTTCLVLHGGARVVLLNFTLEGDTISDFELSSKGLKRIAYPLHTLWSDGDTILPRIGLRKPVSEEQGDVATVEIPGFPWYWVVIMSVVGIFAGIVVGSAIMWRRPTLMKGQPSALTLSDLIGRDGLQEDAVSRASDTLQHPALHRQDSGLTSSSFASFTPCQERPQTAYLFPKQEQQEQEPQQQQQEQQEQQQTQKPDCVPEPASSEPSVYVHVAPISCTSEVVVFEEVEALSGSKVEYNPPDEIKLNPELSGFDKAHSTEHVC